MKNFENNNKKITSTPVAKKKKDLIIQSQFPKRKNSIHQSDISNLMTLLKKFGDGYHKLCLYECMESIEEFKKLPQNQLYTGWVLTSIGRAYMEIVKYN